MKQSPFVYCANNPIIFFDPDGNTIRAADNRSGAAKNLAMIYATPLGRAVIDEMMASNREFTLSSQFFTFRSKYVRSNGVIRYVRDPWSNTISPFDGGGSINSMIAMGHEMWHGFDHLHGNVSMNRERLEAQSPFLEERAVSFGNYLRSAYGLYPLRNGYKSGLQEGDFNQFRGFESSKIDDFTELGVNEDKRKYGYRYKEREEIIDYMFGIPVKNKHKNPNQNGLSSYLEMMEKLNL